MSDYSSVLTYTINRGVAIGAGSIMLSQSGVVGVCLLGTPIQACSPKNPKCEGRTETFYSVLDNSLNQMFVTDERGWAYITSGGRLANVINGDQLAAVPGDREAAIGEVAVLGGQSDVQTYGINRGVSVLRNTISLKKQFYEGFPFIAFELRFHFLSKGKSQETRFNENRNFNL
jgi:hypothetical protein